MGTERTSDVRQETVRQIGPRPTSLAGERVAERSFSGVLGLAALSASLGAPADPAAIVTLQRKIGNRAVAEALVTEALQDGVLAQQVDEDELRKGHQATSTGERVQESLMATRTEPRAGTAGILPAPADRRGQDARGPSVWSPAEHSTPILLGRTRTGRFSSLPTGTVPSGGRAGTPWGRETAAEAARPDWGARPSARAETDQRPSWGAAGGVRPRPLTWGALLAVDQAGAGEDFVAAIGPPGSTTVVAIQGYSGRDSTVGWTYFPTAYRAPDFKFNSTDKGSAGAPKWYASPTSLATAYEGDAASYYAPEGLEKTTKKEGGKDVYFKFSAAMSTRDRDAEQEHCDDFMKAYAISLKEAEDVLIANVYGNDFGPKPTKAEAEQMVLDAIRTNLTHAALGNDKTKWGSKYDLLFRKTVARDPVWHMFALTNRRTNAAGDVIYDIDTGTTKIGVVASDTIIKY